MSITHIYFDWSGTLAKRGSKATFLYSQTTAEKCATLRPGAKELLQHLKQKGYTLGIISNTSKPADLFMKSLEECGLRGLFDGAVILNTMDSRLRRKPAPSMFHRALSTDGISPSQALMIGNDYEKDIVGAERAGLAAVQVL
jgi:HAD superfamily hydrolase (TIGR01662 family)